MAKKVYEVHPRIKEKCKGLKKELMRLTREQCRLKHLRSSQCWKDAQVTKEWLEDVKVKLQQTRKDFIVAEEEYKRRYEE